jgi:hypothetical protein
VPGFQGITVLAAMAGGFEVDGYGRLTPFASVALF